ncbi:glycosyltransferase [bacterium]|nr:glycosyltransferase [bacterium]
MTKPLKARIDLHCHSWASNRPSLWLMQRLGCPESFTPPEHLWNIATQRGMQFVTITDHNTVTGAQEIAQTHDNVIVGEEVTTYFPGNVKVHVGCIDITERQHRDIQGIRENIYDLVEYLDQEGIIYFCAHPLFKINGALKWSHFEQMLLLFKRFEVINGTRLGRMNNITSQLLDKLTKDEIEILANKHGIEPKDDEPWKKYVVAGSDDHSGLFIGTCYTELEVEEYTKDAFLKSLREGKTKACGSSDGCLTLSHQINSIAFQYFRSKVTPESEELLYILGRIFDRDQPMKVSNRVRIKKGVRKLIKYFFRPKQSKVNLVEEIRDIIADNKSLKSLFDEGLMTRDEYNENVFNLASDVLDQMILRVLKKPQLLHYFIVFAPMVLSSYFMVSKNLHGDRDLLEKAEEWLGIKRNRRVAWFTDSFVNMDGVSKTCRKFLNAALERGKGLTVFTCHEEDLSNYEGVINFQPIHEFPTPGYENVKLYVPSILKTFKQIEDGDFDTIVISTPGPVGILGLICAKVMGIPTHGIYHTDLPRIAMRVSGDPMFGELAVQLTRMFYRQVDHVLAPSKWYIDDLRNLGIEEKNTSIMERWVDVDTFSPAKRSEMYWEEHAPVKLLFVGRMSQDKNVDLLIKLYHYLEVRYKNFVLHVVGDGPYYKEMETKTKTLEHFIMTGAKFGEDLAQAYASSDVFIYPGLLDTFGNVIIEAQASGLPCVVMNEGGPKELIVPGETGFISRTEEEFILNTEKFLQDTSLAKTMGEKAVNHARERYTKDRVFQSFWETVNKPLQEKSNGSKFQFENVQPEEKVISLTA